MLIPVVQQSLEPLLDHIIELDLIRDHLPWR
jgi:hypothetical protein